MQMAKLNKTLIVIFLITLTVFVISCQKKLAVGEEDIILVVADQATFNRCKDRLNQVFNHPVYTPMEENHYNLLRVGFTEFVSRNIYKNVILLTDVDQVNPESDFINGMLSEDVKEGVRKGDYFYVFKTDLWARNQNVMILMDSKESRLIEYLEQYKDKVYNALNERNLDLIRERFYRHTPDKKTSEKLLKKYAVEVFIPNGYQLVEEGKNVEFFQLRREFPADRWLTVIRGKYDASLTMQDNIVKLRDLASKEFGDSIRINPEFISFDNDTTFDANGVITKGIWEYSEGGGPFINFAFIKNNLLYMIDCSVFAPGLRKYPHLDQLEVMAKMVKIK